MRINPTIAPQSICLRLKNSFAWFNRDVRQKDENNKNYWVYKADNVPNIQFRLYQKPTKGMTVSMGKHPTPRKRKGVIIDIEK